MKLRILKLTTTDPAWNLAAEEYVFSSLPRDAAYIMLWQNDNAVIVGKYQNTAAEINAEAVRRRGTKVVRRLSGGGAVYHDLGNLNFTLITDADPEGRVNLRLFCEPVVRTLARFGVQADISGRNDITVEGKKFSGNAQYIREGRVMHHGTILFDSDLSAVQEVLAVRAEKIAGKGVDSVRSRVTNLKPYLPGELSLEAFRDALAEEMSAGRAAERIELTAEDTAAIRALKEARYDSWDWNYGASPAASLLKQARFAGCGSVEARMELVKGRIASLRFEGDFFSTEEPSGLAALLAGCKPDREEISLALKGVDISRYFTGLRAEDLIRLLCE